MLVFENEKALIYKYLKKVLIFLLTINFIFILTISSVRIMLIIFQLMLGIFSYLIFSR